MAAVGVLRQLDLVDGDEVGAFVDRHGFDRAGEPAGAGRLDPLFTRNEGAGLLALLLYHLVVDLARKQAQRQADHPRAVRKHPLHSKVRLAGVGGAKDGPDTLVVAGQRLRSR